MQTLCIATTCKIFFLTTSKSAKMLAIFMFYIILNSIKTLKIIKLFWKTSISIETSILILMLDYAGLCYVMLRYATLCYIMIRYATLCYLILVC